MVKEKVTLEAGPDGPEVALMLLDNTERTVLEQTLTNLTLFLPAAPKGQQRPPSLMGMVCADISRALVYDDLVRYPGATLVMQ